MNFSFNYYNKLDDVELYLCNPDGRELYSIVGTDRRFTLRFNDLSQLEFVAPAQITKANGEPVEAEYYALLETTRLIYAPKIGYFRISNVSETDNGVEKSKSITADSLQCMFKNKGFMSEERVYKFYNPDDPRDDLYDSSQEDAIPSVVGQLVKQLGIKLDLHMGLGEIISPYRDWTITYINESLKYVGENSICRTLSEETVYGYDFMVNTIEDAFEVVFIFDFLNRAIQIKTVDEITERANLCLSFHNFMQSIQVDESADEIVTVLSCNGTDVNITEVNPTGTNYVVDFSYYMDEVNHKWMSQDLIDKLKAWKSEVESNKDEYRDLINDLRTKYAERTVLSTQYQEVDLSLSDLKAAERELMIKANERYNESDGTEETFTISADFEIKETAYPLTPREEIKTIYETVKLNPKPSWLDAVIKSPAYIYSLENSNIYDGIILSATLSYGAFIIETRVEDGKYVYLNQGIPWPFQNATLDLEIVYSHEVQPYTYRGEAIVEVTPKFGYVITGEPEVELSEVSSDVTVVPSVIDNVNNRLIIKLNSENVGYSDSSNNTTGTITVTYTAKKLSGISGIVAVETVEVGEKSCVEDSPFYNTELTESSVVKAHPTRPNYDTNTGKWRWDDEGVETEVSSVFNYLNDENSASYKAYYFQDVDDQYTYCVLNPDAGIKGTDDDGTPVVTYKCKSFTRYCGYSKIENGQIVSMIKPWIDLKDGIRKDLEEQIAAYDSEIDSINSNLVAISSRLNLLSYLSDTPELLRELNCYWVESDYVNDNIKCLENTTDAEYLQLANDLLASGETELSKICQPRFSFNLDASIALKQYEFRDQVNEIVLGRVFSAEKEDGLWYSAVLLEMSFNFDANDDFSLTFANQLRLDDWGYTYADLISEASSTSKKVSANWQDLTKYSKNEEFISDLLKNPLDATLRQGFADMHDQSFIVDSTGILGRQSKEDNPNEFEDTQIRILNNLIMFTDNNWSTIKTALGKICWKETKEDGTVEERSSYGLIADTIIGNLVMSKTTKIVNENSSIILDENGILIKKTVKNEDGTAVKNEDGSDRTIETFRADVNGDLKIAGDIVGGTLNINGNFMVDEDGNITAKSGEIAGWQMSDNFLFKVSENATNQTTGIYSGDSKNYDGKNLRFFVQDINELGEVYYPFAVLDDGSLHATRAYITGEMNANTGSIANFMIDGNSIMGYDKNGYMQVGMCSQSGDRYAFWAGGDGKLPDTEEYQGQKTTRFVVGHDGYLCASDAHISGEINAEKGRIGGFSINEWGLYWGNPDAYKPQDYYHTLITDNVVSADWGIFNTARIAEVSIATDDSGEPFIGMWDKSKESYWVGITPGYLKVDTIGLSSTAMCKWLTIVGHIGNETSDARLKNNINTLDDSYELLFDSLSPKKYKYNNGTSGRYHTGFIAQEVVSSLENAGLTTQDFAAVMLNDPGTDEEYWSLRRDEFVALNTWQIQKLKARVVKLEKMVAELKTKVN